jgi:DNA-binding CsgD family transcriptional regulator
MFRRRQQVPQVILLRELTFQGNDEKKSFYNLNPERALLLYEQAGLSMPHKLNAISLRFSSAVYEAAGSIEFSFRLRGFDSDWSSWTKLTYKEYTNLPEGSYVFDVKQRLTGGTTDEVFSFPFEIKPPFYRTTIAYIVYVFMLVLFVIGNVIILQRRIAHSVNEEREKHEKKMLDQQRAFREQALIAEKEIINLRNDALQNEVEHKNKELANTTLHLIHKNKILNAIKSSLVQLNDNGLNQRKKDELETLIARINRELKNERFQKLFDETFDQVHDDFLSRLKQRHPELTSRELRLCAFLRMNLSTKEIAPLMNISVRGVEIGRYRLRKKLNLERDENLIDYLIKF